MKPIANFEAKYLITEHGKVMSLRNNSYIKLSLQPNGYLKAALGLNGEKDQRLVHRLVALHFIPNPYGYEQVNHKNGIKTDNRVVNLEWCSREQNIQHSLKTGLRKGFMSFDDKKKYLRRILAGEQVKTIADEIGRHPNTLSRMCRETADKVGLTAEWQEIMQQRRKHAAIRNLTKISP